MTPKLPPAAPGEDQLVLERNMPLNATSTPVTVMGLADGVKAMKWILANASNATIMVDVMGDPGPWNSIRNLAWFVTYRYLLFVVCVNSLIYTTWLMSRPRRIETMHPVARIVIFVFGAISLGLFAETLIDMRGNWFSEVLSYFHMFCYQIALTVFLWYWVNLSQRLFPVDAASRKQIVLSQYVLSPFLVPSLLICALLVRVFLFIKQILALTSPAIRLAIDRVMFDHQGEWLYLLLMGVILVCGTIGFYLVLDTNPNLPADHKQVLVEFTAFATTIISATCLQGFLTINYFTQWHKTNDITLVFVPTLISTFYTTVRKVAILFVIGIPLLRDKDRKTGGDGYRDSTVISMDKSYFSASQF